MCSLGKSQGPLGADWPGGGTAYQPNQRQVQALHCVMSWEGRGEEKDS